MFSANGRVAVLWDPDAHTRESALRFTALHLDVAWERCCKIRLEILVHCNTTWFSRFVQFASNRRPAKDSVMGQSWRGL